MFTLAYGLRALRHLFVTALFALPDGERAAGIGGVLINGAIGRNDFSFATRADSTACGSLFNIDA